MDKKLWERGERRFQTEERNWMKSLKWESTKCAWGRWVVSFGWGTLGWEGVLRHKIRWLYTQTKAARTYLKSKWKAHMEIVTSQHFHPHIIRASKELIALCQWDFYQPTHSLQRRAETIMKYFLFQMERSKVVLEYGTLDAIKWKQIKIVSGMCKVGVAQGFKQKHGARGSLLEGIGMEPQPGKQSPLS